MPDIIKEASNELVIVSPLETSLVITEDVEFRVVEVIDRGVQGQQGERGSDGKTPDHEWVGTALRFEKPDGVWGKLVDLQGPKGERGPTGYSSGGGTGFDPSGLGMATDMPLPAEMIVQQGGAWVRATWAQVVAWLGGVVPPVGGGVILTEDGSVLLTEDNNRLEME